MTLLQMTRGNTYVLTETIDNLPGSGLAGCSLWLTAKYHATDADAAAVFQILPTSWSVTTVGSNIVPGVATCTITPAMTAPISYYTTLLSFDVQLEDASHNVSTIDSGFIRIVPNITRAS